jgi:hypothetical protein
MAAFEWMELQTLTNDISDARSRLAEARSAKDQRRVRALEQEIAAAERRRARLLAFLTDHLADTTQPAPPQNSNEDAPSAAADYDAPVAVDAEAPVAADEEAPVAADEIGPPAAPDPADRAGLYAALAADAADTSSLKGDGIVWEQLTPGDIERAERELATRRDDMLARHAEELKTLDEERDRLASLEQAIAAFVQSFGAPSGGEVVQLGDEREMRALGRG